MRVVIRVTRVVRSLEAWIGQVNQDLVPDAGPWETYCRFGVMYLVRRGPALYVILEPRYAAGARDRGKVKLSAANASHFVYRLRPFGRVKCFFFSRGILLLHLLLAISRSSAVACIPP
jgi:hypothetical protein